MVVNAVEQLETVEADVEENEYARCPFAGRHLAVLMGRTIYRPLVGGKTVKSDSVR